MSQPLPFETQNVHDDDAQVLDSFFVETDAPANLGDAAEPIVVKYLKEPAKITRIISGTQTYGSANNGTYVSPIQILPADDNRVDLAIKAFSTATTITDFVYVAGENGLLNSQGAGRLRTGQPLDLSNHTGAVFLLPGPNLTADFEVSWWATTC